MFRNSRNTYTVKNMKRGLVLIALTLCGWMAHAQTLEVNPNVTNWQIVISHDIPLTSGNFTSYEFPAEKNYNYIFNLTHSLKNMHAVLMVYDMQDALVDKIVVDTNDLVGRFKRFSVEESGTYRVIVGLTDPNGKKGSSATFTICTDPSCKNIITPHLPFVFIRYRLG